jgi:ornithine cyclodeaminase/alanine dehydrogenase-like protein (mu-crystallin family)
MPTPVMLGAEDVERHLSMPAAIEAMRSAMAALASGRVVMPPRQISRLADGSGFLGVMPGSALAPDVYGAKLLSLHPGNSSKGLPTIQGVVVLFDHQTGTPSAILDGGTITAIRTAATSALATDLLARQDVRTHGIMGTGLQARRHAEAIWTVRPGLAETIVWGRNRSRAELLATELSETWGRRVRATDDAREAATCDIVTTVTASKTPVLQGEWLLPGSHLNLVGAHAAADREADAAAIARSRLVVDLREAAMTEAGDLVLAIAEKAVAQDHVAGDLGGVVLGTVPGRTRDDEVTAFKSVGLVAQDLFAAHAALRRYKGADDGAGNAA